MRSTGAMRLRMTHWQRPKKFVIKGADVEMCSSRFKATIRKDEKVPRSCSRPSLSPADISGIQI